jgi:hypothetical protein
LIMDYRLFFCALAAISPAFARQVQNPSPMVEHTRPPSAASKAGPPVAFGFGFSFFTAGRWCRRLQRKKPVLR